MCVCVMEIIMTFAHTHSQPCLLKLKILYSGGFFMTSTPSHKNPDFLYYFTC
jgi:hypothetical protein